MVLRKVGVALKFSRAQSVRSFNRTPLREILDPPLRLTHPQVHE